MQLLDVVHLVGESWDEIQDGDDVCDAECCRHGRVLSGVEIAEVESGDYEIWMTNWGFGEGRSVHDEIYPRAGAERDDWGG